MMDPDLLQRLPWFVSDPEEAVNLPGEDIPALLGALEALRARLWSRLTAPSLPQGDPEPSQSKVGVPKTETTVGKFRDGKNRCGRGSPDGYRPLS